MPTLAIPDTVSAVEVDISLESGARIDLLVQVGDTRADELARAKKPVPNPMRIKGLIDTGASGVALDYTVAIALGLQPTNYTPHLIPGGRKYAPVIYPKITVVMQPLSFEMDGHKCSLFNNLRTEYFDALVGLDLLQHLFVCFNGPMGKCHALMPSGVQTTSLGVSPSLGAAYYDASTDAFMRWNGGEFVRYSRKRKWWFGRKHKQ